MYSEVVVPGVTYRVVFDKPVLLPRVTLANWFVVHVAQNWNATAVVAAGNNVTLTVAAGIGFTPPEGIDYYATPANLTGLTGLPVAPFVRLPFGP